MVELRAFQSEVHRLMMPEATVRTAVPTRPAPSWSDGRGPSPCNPKLGRSSREGVEGKGWLVMLAARRRELFLALPVHTTAHGEHLPFPTDTSHASRVLGTLSAAHVE